MTTVTQKFFQIEVSISDERTSLIELNQLCFNTISLLIPEARKAIDEERKQILNAQVQAEADTDCEDGEECPYAKEKAEQNKVNELYV
jgi:hypothetical protein